MPANGERAPVTTGPLPIEDADRGLDLHGTAVTTITGPDGTATYLVSAEDFMAMQKERDDYRRVLALINAWRRTPGRDEVRLRSLLAGAGFDDGAADAMRSLIAWAQDPNRG